MFHMNQTSQLTADAGIPSIMTPSMITGTYNSTMSPELGSDDLPSIPPNMALLHLLTYQVMYPILIVFGLVTNGLCIAVTSKKKLRRYHVNAYIKVLSITDLLGVIVCVPAAMSRGDCAFESKTMAVYFAHCCWSLVNLSKTLSFYVITWLAYDRFLAVWCFKRFQKVEKTGVLKQRMFISFILGLGAFLPIMINGNVRCIGSSCNSTVNSSSKVWLAIDGYSYNFNESWHKVFMVIHGLLVNWLPGLLLMFLSLGLMLALAQGRVRHHTNTKRRSKMFFQTVTLLTMAISFILCSLPITVVILFISDKQEGLCYVSFKTEVVRSIGTLMQMSWHIFNVTSIFFLNKEYRLELRVILERLPVLGCLLVRVCCLAGKTAEQQARDIAFNPYSDTNSTAERFNNSVTDRLTNSVFDRMSNSVSTKGSIVK